MKLSPMQALLHSRIWFRTHNSKWSRTDVIRLVYRSSFLYLHLNQRGSHVDYDNWEFRSTNFAVFSTCNALCAYSHNELYYCLRQSQYASQWRYYLQIHEATSLTTTNRKLCGCKIFSDGLENPNCIKN